MNRLPDNIMIYTLMKNINHYLLKFVSKAGHFRYDFVAGSIYENIFSFNFVISSGEIIQTS